MLVARELLIDLERTDVNVPLPANSSAAAASRNLPAACPPGASGDASSSGGGGFDAKHREVLLVQVDELRERLLAEQQASEALRQENERLAHDLRSLASQLKQERAASNAVLTAQAVPDPRSSAMPDGAAPTGELTLASAASQILLLRREVKFLQKQWNQARVDQKSATTREQIQELRDEAAEARRVAAAAEESSASISAKARIAMRELQVRAD